jgi:TolB-like protein/class 3 adenylate cyclase/Tfp pilus assembly protein PilF
VVEPRVERKLAAILAADMVGYGRLTGADEEGTLARLRALRHEVIDPAIGSHRGRIVKTTGDGLLAEFPSAVDAVRCAIEVQRAIAPVNAKLAPEQWLEFRIGINVGDVVVDGDDLLGDSVNVAARLEGIAEPGGVCLSEDAYRQVRGKVAAEFVDLGEQSLKNVARPIRAYRIDMRNANGARAPGAAQAGAQKPALALPDMPSIAVLPFTNMSGDPEQEYFADGMVEDIITGLSRIKWLFVIARNSSFLYKGKAVDVKQVGRELGVRYVLEGGVRRAGSRVRITGQLIEAVTGIHLWAERYDRSLDDIFALQDEITMRVVGSIEPSLRRAEIERVKRQRPDSLDAYDLFLRALPFIYTPMPHDAARAIPLLEKALELEPGYASAQAALAWCFHQRFSRGGLREEDRAAAIRHARAATTHGGDDATTLAMAGFVIWMDEGDDVAALKLFDRALALSSSNLFALACSTVPLAWMGKTELATERAQRALRLSPFDPLNFLPNCALAIVHFHAKRYAEAADAARSAIESTPRFSLPHAYLAAALVRLGRGEEARAAARQVLALQPGFTVHGFAVIVGHEPAVFAPFAEAWRDAGLPE